MENKTENLAGFQKKIIDQIEGEYSYSKKVLQPKIDEWLQRLKIYNNQRKEKTSVGDPLLFTVFQTILASLYDDKLAVSFDPREGGDIETSDNLNQLAEFDYQAMEKDVLDFEWDWDTLFFGRGFIFNMEFDRKKMIPLPEVVSPLTLLRDPQATSVNGNRKGYGAARFFGREMALTQWQLENNKSYFNIKSLKIKEGDDLLKEAIRKRREAQGLSDVWSEEDKLGDNAYYDILEWFTHIDGEKYLVALGNQRTEIVRFQKLKDQSKWPVIDRALFPISHDWDGVSIPDLVEDKQRARAKLINLGLDTAAANSNPMYLFDVNRIKRKDHLDFQFNKFIPVDGDPSGAVAPMTKDRVGQEVQWIMQLLDESTQRALSTPELQMGMISQRQRTLGELELVSAKVDTRHSLSAKIFGWSERRFWERWYWLYKNHFKDNIDEKVIRLVGVWGAEFRPLKRENIIAKTDPDIRVESAIVSNANRITQRELFRAFMGMASGMPDFPIRYALKEFAKLNNFRTDQVKILFPPTFDEMKAEKENEEMEGGGVPLVSLLDEHMVHLLIHSKLQDNDARKRHTDNHYLAMKIQKENAKMFAAEGIGVPGAPIPIEAGKMKVPEAKIGAEPEGVKRRSAVVPGVFGQ